MAIDLKMNVLVVDDYSSIVRAIRRVLKAAGFADANIDSDLDAASALARLRRGDKNYGLILSDYHMEPMDGLEFLKTVRADPALKGIKFVMATATDNRAVVQAALDAGADNYLLKPFGTEVLLRQLERIF